MTKFEHKESGYHRCAKETLTKWLKEGFDDITKYDFPWGGDGVHMEYAITHVGESDHFAHNNPYWDSYNEFENSDWNPSYDECVKVGQIPIAILDIAIVSKGYITYGFEICYTNPVSIAKKAKLQQLSGMFGIYEIDADAILKLTSKPKTILNLCTQIN